MEDQSGDKWLNWRAQGLGSSDAPIIMGVSPFTTPFQLWQEKCGILKRDVSNFATERGHRLEPKARAHYELMTGTHMPAVCLEAAEAPWLRASLDGFDGEKILEIKCPGKSDHATALKGEIPEKYYPQLQHQMIVANVDHNDYFSFDGEDGVIVPCAFNEDYALMYLEKALEFWNCVQTRTPPPYARKDYKMVKDPELLKMIKLWRMTGADVYKQDVLDKLNGRRVRQGIYFIDENGIHTMP